MTIKTFRNLEVWQLSHKLTLSIYKTTELFPLEERFGLISQLRRSAASICANLAEGYRKPTKDFMRFIDMSLGSLEETKYHLILAHDLRYQNDASFNQMYWHCEKIGAKLTNLKLGLKKRLVVRQASQAKL